MVALGSVRTSCGGVMGSPGEGVGLSSLSGHGVVSCNMDGWVTYIGAFGGCMVERQDGDGAGCWVSKHDWSDANGLVNICCPVKLYRLACLTVVRCSFCGVYLIRYLVVYFPQAPLPLSLYSPLCPAACRSR